MSKKDEVTEQEVENADVQTSLPCDEVSLEEDASEQAADTDDVSEKLDRDTVVDPLAKAEAELEKAKDQVLRHQAEVQNIKRRSDQDVEKARKYALERFCDELLPVVDSLERALLSATPEIEDVPPIVEGVELTLKMFVDTLAKFNIEQIDPEGEPFDPKLHQAMSMVENQDVEPNTVLSVMQRGYVLNGRLIRPAMVMVSKPSD